MLIAGLRLIGIVAPMVLAGPINGRSFQTYVDRVLIPDLRLGDIVIMDNLGPHKGPDVQAAIEAAGATIRYLPPYSPNFNPIEKAFSKLKARLRKGVEHTHDALWDRISTLIDQLPPPQNATTSSQPQNMNQIKKTLQKLPKGNRRNSKESFRTNDVRYTASDGTMWISEV